MNCKNCGAELQEKTSFCSRCGQDLRGISEAYLIESQQLTMKIELPKKTKMSRKLMKKFSKIINLSKIQASKKAKESHKLMKKFLGNIHLKNIELYKKIKGLHKLMKKIPESIYSKELVIIDGWTWVAEDNYTYLRGSVKNIGKITIKYFEVNAKYNDLNKNVLDSDFTKWDRKIQPGESKEFEIKHHINKKYQSIDISVNKYKKKLWR
ncbi:zinc ribbon domain-containing protein [Clostridium tagluense]|uniref:zinc ribbon domain-containing protein n=1 Tax=Clostridium TaxID=1485 RepID=UPI0013E97D96|nr:MULTISPECIES: zinc ribbon domain-containing protein [Clostridium]MBW9155232.1 zinc ribbon domain-containing protein [Clostridium tagluense]MBZ9624847.1 zinc ribbon domain-containing protein [Clostridium sp. FP2]MCB2312661.1 zinc ribbon domain-containing protein [Clostridium tagluense]MCB2317427.1 zinc ribbon domain-containing protein [Clostridium tagluense]MCB2322224.1 zinc ribbon domain-containing protein [Clostridium tagluense]